MQKIQQLQKQIRHLKRLSSTPGLTLDQAKALEEKRDEQSYYRSRLDTLADIRDPRLPDTSRIPLFLRKQWRNAQNGKPVAKWINIFSETDKFDAHERLTQEKKELEARNKRFQLKREAKELQRRRSPGYFTARGYWHTDYIYPGLPKRYQQYKTETLILGAQVRENWISGSCYQDQYTTSS